MRDGENHTYTLKHIIVLKNILYVSILSHLNRHILSDNIEKVEEEEELTNVPPPSRGFLTNSPLPGPTR